MKESHRTMHHWVLRAAAVAAVIILLLGIASFGWPPEMSASHTAPTVVVALSSGVDEDSTLDAQGSERLRVAASEAARHGVPLYTTRFVGTDGMATDTGQARILAETGYRGEWRIAGIAVGSTRDEALAVRSMLPPSVSVEVVTSALHARRACAAFRAVGLAVVCETRYEDPRWYRRPFDLAYELLAMVKYRSQGWVSP